MSLLRLAGLALLVSTIPATWAQSRTSLRARVPFEFTAGKTVLPAGNYEFTEKPGTPWLSIRGENGKSATAAVLTSLGGGAPFRDATLVFDCYESRHTLSEVWMTGGGLLVHSTPSGHSHDTVVAVVSGNASRMSGKAVFEHTCARCHGPGGRGNGKAEAFFGASIPKLDSEYVQGKSDEELREIITNGRRNMDPVRIGQASVQHLLPTESVGEVIGYIRTLKR